MEVSPCVVKTKDGFEPALKINGTVSIIRNNACLAQGTAQRIANARYAAVERFLASLVG